MEDNQPQPHSRATYQKQQQGSQIQKTNIVPATSKEKALLVLFLAVTTFIFLFLGEWSLRCYDESIKREVVAQWKAQPGVVLHSGPASLQIDYEKAVLLHRGQINDRLKKELLALINVDDITPELRQQVMDSYSRAIDSLAYLSNEKAYLTLLFLMALAGIGGVIGVQIRSISNFIGVACFKNELDLKRWWPWYVLRPVLGLLMGVLVVILVKAKLFMGAEQVDQDNLWWLGLSVLTGFGASDFSERLRLLAQTLFGKTKG